jgi:Flp pilus assembly protein TadG
MARGALQLKNSSGQAAVEFTLVFLLFLMLMYLIVEGARLTFAYSSASQAARAGVRYASVRGSTSTCTGCPASVTAIQNYVKAQTPGTHLKSVDVCWWEKTSGCTTTGSKEPGANVRVSVQIDFKPILSMVPIGTTAIKSKSEMVISN